MDNKYFGVVTDIGDPDKRFRIRAKISGYTDLIPIDKLPWYFPSVVNYLPNVGDSVMITCFNGDITKGFYGRKIDIENMSLSDGNDYELYLEVYNKLKVQINFIESIGIQFINDKSSQTISPKSITLKHNKTKTVITDGKITSDNGGEIEPATLGETTEETLKRMITLYDSQYKEILTILDKIKTVCTTPFLIPIKGALTPLIPLAKSKFTGDIKTLKSDTVKIKSKVNFIE